MRHTIPAEQQHAEKRRLEKEGDDNLNTRSSADHVAEDCREAAPIGAELIERTTPTPRPSRTRREDLGPEAREHTIMLSPVRIHITQSVAM